MKKIGIFCDLSPSSGLGHIRRMKFLTNELEKFNVKCFFFFDEKYKKFIKKYAKNLKLIFFSKKNLNEFDCIKLLVNKHKISKMIFDTYKDIYLLEKNISQMNVLTVSIDDHARKHATDIVCTNRSDKINKDFPEQVWLRGSRYILIKKIKKNKIKKKSKIKILLHAGGSSVYKPIKFFCESIFGFVEEHDLRIDILCSTEDSKRYIKNLSKKIIDKNKINYLNYNENFANSFYKYDLIAGPLGTTTYESILAGVLPFSTILYNDGRDSMVSWNNIGHLMHLNEKEKNNKKILYQSLKLIIEKRKILLKKLKKNSKDLDGLGPKRLAREIIFFSKKRSKKISFYKKELPSKKLELQKCIFADMRKFLFTRNQKQNRVVSSNPKHIITWPEHVSWWINDKIKKYKIVKDNVNVGYFWTKMLTDEKGSFVVTGWFFDNNQREKLMISNQISRFMFQMVKKFYKNHTWVITFRHDNDFLYRLNLQYGFKDPSELSKERAFRVFNYSPSKFKVMELKI